MDMYCFLESVLRLGISKYIFRSAFMCKMRAQTIGDEDDGEEDAAAVWWSKHTFSTHSPGERTQLNLPQIQFESNRKIFTKNCPPG